jgi:hypothetical protein
MPRDALCFLEHYCFPIRLLSLREVIGQLVLLGQSGMVRIINPDRINLMRCMRGM